MIGRKREGGARRLRLNRRGASPAGAAAVLVVVAILVGAGGYYGIKNISSSSTSTSCQPVSVCKPTSATNDVSVFIPYTPGFGQQLLSVAEGQSIPATVSLTGGEAASSFAISWGDGASDTSAQGSFAHSYSSLGQFVIIANATVGSVVHTGSSYYFPIETTPTLGNLSLGYFPTLTTRFSNGTSNGIYPWLQAGGTVSVSGTYSAPPVDLNYTPRAPSLVSTGGHQSDYVSNSTSASANYTFANPGIYDITLVVAVTSKAPTLYQNFTWEVDVLSLTALGPSCSECKAPSATSPHSGTLNVVEDGGPPIGGLDPAYDYDTVGEEPIWNVFETLVAYNGTDVGVAPSNFMPEIATCVPGSAECGAQYPTAPGTDLVVYNHSSPEYWTFVIDKGATFWDPTTGLAQPVYPTDVMFSIARALAFADLPGPGYYNGWILGQALLPTGNPAWDSGYHAPYNNTPADVYGSMLINDTRYCPTKAISSENGCVTFNAWGGGAGWPNFLQLIADPLGGSIEECSYYVALGVQTPGYSGRGTNQPCGLPGGVAGNTTNSSAWRTYLAHQAQPANATLWDSYSVAAAATYPVATAASRLVAAGSGPYHLVGSANFEIGYVLQANPYYKQPLGCAGQIYCLPAPGAYATHVNVQWLLTDQQGIADFEAGYADVAGIYPSDTTTLITLLQKGLVGLETVPTLSVNFLIMNLQIDLTELKSIDIYKTNIQANTFSFIGLRDFMAATLPYATIESTLFTADHIQYDFNFGGFIPEDMANYYSTTIPYPNYNVTTGQFINPVTNATNPNAWKIPYTLSWYWSQMLNRSSPLYDPQFGSGSGKYNSHNPLVFPLIGEIGNTPLDSTYVLLESIISQVTGGAIQPDTFDLSFSQIGANIGAPGDTGLGFWNLAWAPDYANPWDYAVPLVLPNGTYTGPDAVYQALDGDYGGNYANTSDPWCTNHVDPTMANATYWADLGFVPQDCQGIAYNITVTMIDDANANPNVAQGKLQYDLADAIFVELGLMIPDGQANSVVVYAPWINPTSIDTNIVVSAGAVTNAWFDYRGNGVVS